MNDLVRITDATLATSVPAPTIRRWIAIGWLPSRKINGVRYVHLDRVQEIRDTLKARSALRYLTR